MKISKFSESPGTLALRQVAEGVAVGEILSYTPKAKPPVSFVSADIDKDSGSATLDGGAHRCISAPLL